MISETTTTTPSHLYIPDSLSSSDVPYNNSEAPPTSFDCELWQSVVDEGPAAVARSSPEDLNKAITDGIPNVIRGAVWQILAESKNEELEIIYKNLVARGTEKDPDRVSVSSGFGSFALSSINGKDEATTSSSSSIHSDSSTAAISTLNAIRSPSVSRDIEALAKGQEMTFAEKKKKAQDDNVALRKLEKAIRRDLGDRTSFSKFTTSASLQEGLFGVCKAYALYDEAVGYAQGLNFIAMPLLFNMPEEEAFCLLVNLMNKYHLRDLFIQDMPGLHMRLYQFERLLEDLEPALYCHLQRRQVTPHLYATQWFLTLFTYRFPLQLVLRIYDLIISEGLEAVIKFGVALMQKNASKLLQTNDLTMLINFLKDGLFDVYIDDSPSRESILESGFFGSSGSNIDKEVYRTNELIQDACAVKISPDLLSKYVLEWEEKNREEKEREAEIQDLRFDNKKLSHKVRKLEERVQDHDTEHAALATELVMTKIKNEEITDENESLKVQVQELRKMVDKLPLHIEQTLKIEMDRLIQRNKEVYEENSRIEAEMSEMEKNLVDTKLQYAEIQAAYETLSRKWNDLRKALGD